MKFQLRPILSEINAFYQKPISPERFQAYIQKLEGGKKGDLGLPISGFNPMAKNHILEKIEELENLEAENLIEKTIEEFNSTLKESTESPFLVVLNIADDLQGGWTNHYSTDFDSKFKLNAFIERKFCVPYFWAGETYSTELIKNRTLAYLNRTIYRTHHPQPITLEEHLEQEIYVASKINRTSIEDENTNFRTIEKFYLENKNTEAQDKIFNFFYGDKGAESLNYKKFGITEIVGFDYAKLISKRRMAS